MEVVNPLCGQTSSVLNGICSSHEIIEIRDLASRHAEGYEEYQQYQRYGVPYPSEIWCGLPSPVYSVIEGSVLQISIELLETDTLYLVNAATVVYSILDSGAVIDSDTFEESSVGVYQANITVPEAQKENYTQD